MLIFITTDSFTRQAVIADHSLAIYQRTTNLLDFSALPVDWTWDARIGPDSYCDEVFVLEILMTQGR